MSPLEGQCKPPAKPVVMIFGKRRQTEGYGNDNPGANAHVR